MTTPENTFIESVHRHLPPGRTDPYWMKNNNLYTSGIWDCWYSGPAADLWVEYKFITVPKRGDTMIMPALSALQVDWGHKRLQEGRNMAVIVGCKDGGVIFENLEWEAEIASAAFKVRVRHRAEVAQWLMTRTMLPGVLRKRA